MVDSAMGVTEVSMSSSKYEIQGEQGASMAGAEEQKFQSGWVEWTVANLLIGASPKDMLQALKKAGFSEAYAAAKLDECQRSPVILAADQGLAVQRKAYDILESLS